MKISIVTVTLNCSDRLAATFGSILRQSHAAWESVVVDGASADGTPAMLASIEKQVPGRVRWVSEPDGGIYDAMNKGLALPPGWQPANPTFYARRECFARFGGFDTSLDVSADFDLMLRFLEQQRISNSYIPRTLVRMLSGGESNGSLRNIAVAHRNIYRSFRKYGYKVPRLYSMRRLLPKILNVIKVRLR